MNFSEKLLKLRKEKKYSQEELADKLDVTRQSVSKWESGQTYPEMDKLIAICKIFDCSLEELTNDDIKISDFNKESKNNAKSILDSILDFINQTFNYFSHITFKEFIKCVITMVIVLFVISLFKHPFDELEYAISKGLGIIRRPFIYNYLTSMFNFIIDCAYIISASFLFIYIFKIGFLDKTVYVKEDEKEIIIEDKSKENENKAKREVAHKNYTKAENRLLNVLGSIIMFFIKTLLIFAAIPFIILIVFLSFCLAIDISLIFKGIIILGALFGLIFAIMLTSLVIEFITNIVLNHKHNVKRMLVTLLIGLIGGGLSIGILAIELSSYEYLVSPIIDQEPMINTYNFEYNDGLYIEDYNNIVYEIDNSLKNNIKIEIKNYENLYEIYPSENSYYNAITFKDNRSNINFKHHIDLIIGNLKEKKIYDYYNYDDPSITIYTSEKTLNKLKDNKNAINNQLESNSLIQENNNLSEENGRLYEKISSLEERLSELENENNELKNKVEYYKEKISSIIE